MDTVPVGALHHDDFLVAHPVNTRRGGHPGSNDMDITGVAAWAPLGRGAIQPGNQLRIGRELRLTPAADLGARPTGLDGGFDFTIPASRTDDDRRDPFGHRAARDLEQGELLFEGEERLVLGAGGLELGEPLLDQRSCPRETLAAQTTPFEDRIGERRRRATAQEEFITNGQAAHENQQGDRPQQDAPHDRLNLLPAAA